MPLDILLEGVLFYKATPQNKQKLMTLLTATPEDFAQAVVVLRTRLEAGAIRLIETETDIQLVTAPALSDIVTALQKNELSGDIGKAGAETLAIILYREPISRAEVDRIRGVNSSFIIRNLLQRGLITREAAGQHGFTFRISTALLQQLGITDKRELPRYSEFMSIIDAFGTETT